jgi:actin-like ATPase involved in cell morphogenesis
MQGIGFMYDPLGLSIGTTNLVAVRNGNPPVTRRAVLTLFPHRAPEVGLPAENANLTETGALLSGFVERIGGSVALVSADGTAHEADLLLVEALDAMVTATGAVTSTSQIAIAVPAHWGPKQVQTLRNGLHTHAGFVRNGVEPALVSDAVAALSALNSEARLPGRGMVALFDFGGGGTSITLADAGSNFRPIGETLRYPEFSGNHIDQALLVEVLADVGDTGSTDPGSTAAVGQLGQLREECRRVKERLSTETVTELIVDLPGNRSTIQVSRAKLENLIEEQLSGVLSAFDDLLARNGIGHGDLAAVATAGGGASIPLLTQRLSAHTRVALVTAKQPGLCMAIGAAMFASREPVDEDRKEVAPVTAMAAAVGATTSIIGLPAGDGIQSSTLRELAWSQVDDTGDEPLLYAGEPYDDEGSAPPSEYLPTTQERPQTRFHWPHLLAGFAALIALVAVGGVAYTLTSTTSHRTPPTSTAVPLPPVSSAPPSPASPPPSPASPPPSAAPTPSIAPPPPSSAAPPPATTSQPPSTTTTEQPTTTTTATTTTTTTSPPPTTTPTTKTTVPMTTDYLTIPLVPVPIPIQVPQNQPALPQNPFLNPGGGS